MFPLSSTIPHFIKVPPRSIAPKYSNPFFCCVFVIFLALYAPMEGGPMPWWGHMILILIGLPGLFLAIKAWTFKVVINDETITAFSLFKKPFTFEFSDIVSAVRQRKDNLSQSERIVIKTKQGKKLILESAEVGYELFRKSIREKIDSSLLTGF